LISPYWQPSSDGRLSHTLYERVLPPVNKDLLMNEIRTLAENDRISELQTHLTTTFPHEEKANAAVIAALRSPPPTDTTFTPTGWHANIQYLLSRKDSEELIRRFAWNAP